MKTLITGGAGFIGSYLAHALLEAEHDVFVLADLSTRSIDNIEPLKTHPRFGYAIDTITNEPAWRWSPSLGNLVGYEPRIQVPEILTKVIEHHRATDGMRAAGRRRTRGLQGRYLESRFP